MPIISYESPENANLIRPEWGGLVQHIMTMVRQNRQVRDRLYKSKWDQYERTFRGVYAGADKTRDNERSKLVSPALSASIESVCATIEDAIFSRERWFDMEDDVQDQDRDDVEKMHALLEEDFDYAGVPDAIAKVVLNGAIYGTGIGKINIVRREVRRIVNGQVQKDFRPFVTLEAIPPWEFVIDSQARDIESAHFVAHETFVPKNVIRSRMAHKIYRTVPLISTNTTMQTNPADDPRPPEDTKSNPDDGSVFITEYYGLVPASMLRGVAEYKSEDVQGNGYVEVICTIANEMEVLRCVVNPFSLKDRPIIAYQHSVVPGKFWGRGVAEKGWNAQRALDAELRARMDALGLISAPMLGVDITRLPRTKDMQVRPGKIWLTRGKPSEVLEPIRLGELDTQTFNQSAEMERLVQVGTGAIESNAPLNVDRRNETASGISMIQSSALKRMRRTMWNIERQFLNPLVKKSITRLQQFNPSRYPKDYDFCVKGTLGIVAREYEQSQLIGMLSNIPPESPYYQLILRAIVELSVSPKRDEIIKSLDEMSKPDPQKKQQEQMMQQIQLESAKEALKEQVLKNAKTQAEIAYINAQTEYEKKLTSLEDEKVTIQAANTVIGRQKLDVQREQTAVQREKNHLDAHTKEKQISKQGAKK